MKFRYANCQSSKIPAWLFIYILKLCFSREPKYQQDCVVDYVEKKKDRIIIYSINEGNESTWDSSIKEYIQSKKYPTTGKPYSARYVGSMVADVHRTIKYGGIFLYPASKSNPNGKVIIFPRIINLT